MNNNETLHISTKEAVASNNNAFLNNTINSIDNLKLEMAYDSLSQDGPHEVKIGTYNGKDINIVLKNGRKFVEFDGSSDGLFSNNKSFEVSSGKELTKSMIEDNKPKGSSVELLQTDAYVSMSPDNATKIRNAGLEVKSEPESKKSVFETKDTVSVFNEYKDFLHSKGIIINNNKLTTKAGDPIWEYEDGENIKFDNGELIIESIDGKQRLTLGEKGGEFNRNQEIFPIFYKDIPGIGTKEFNVDTIINIVNGKGLNGEYGIFLGNKLAVLSSRDGVLYSKSLSDGNPEQRLN